MLKASVELATYKDNSVNGSSKKYGSVIIGISFFMTKLLSILSFLLSASNYLLLYSFLAKMPTKPFENLKL